MPSGPEWIIVLVVVLVIFGGSQLPKLARNLGKAQKEFKDGLDEGKADADRPAVETAQTRAETARVDQPRTEPASTEKPNEA